MLFPSLVCSVVRIAGVAACDECLHLKEAVEHGLQSSRPVAAEREIFGNTQIKTAGIRLTGTPKESITEAYT